jgi:subtilisin family serine protease
METSALAAQAAFDLIGAPRGQAALSTRARTVAVLDSGVHWRHPYLLPHCRDSGWDFVEDRPDATPDAHSDHGTQMAGVIAAFASRVGMSLRLLPLRVTGVFASGNGAGFSSSRVTRAIDLAMRQGVDVIVLARSWPQDSLAVRHAIQAATTAGVLVVVASGNACEEIERHRHIPALYASAIQNCVIAVRAFGTQGECKSNYFADVPLLAAPGNDIKTTSGANRYTDGFGESSAAAAIVAAAAAFVSDRILTSGSRAPAAVAQWLRAHARPTFHSIRTGSQPIGCSHYLKLDLRDLSATTAGAAIPSTSKIQTCR